MSTYDCTVFQLHESAFWENFIKDALDDTVRVGSVSVEELTSWTIHPAAELGFIVCCLETEADIEAFVSAIGLLERKVANLAAFYWSRHVNWLDRWTYRAILTHLFAHSGNQHQIYSLERTKITPRVSKTVQ